MRPIVICAALIAGGGFLGVSAQHESEAHGLYLPSDVSWGAGPASLPAGASAAVLEGDPTKEGAFTLRLKLPDGYRIPPHYHPVVEHITVLQGTFVLSTVQAAGKGTEKALTAGSFAFMPAGMRHFVRTEGETIVQLHGSGPWGITYVNPSDDPRQKK